MAFSREGHTLAHSRTQSFHTRRIADSRSEFFTPYIMRA